MRKLWTPEGVKRKKQTKDDVASMRGPTTDGCQLEGFKIADDHIELGALIQFPLEQSLKK